MENQRVKITYCPASSRFRSNTADNYLGVVAEQSRIRSLGRIKSTAVFTPALTYIYESEDTDQHSYYSYENESHRKISSAIARYGVQVWNLLLQGRLWM